MIKSGDGHKDGQYTLCQQEMTGLTNNFQLITPVVWHAAAAMYLQFRNRFGLIDWRHDKFVVAQSG